MATQTYEQRLAAGAAAKQQALKEQAALKPAMASPTPAGAGAVTTPQAASWISTNKPTVKTGVTPAVMPTPAATTAMQKGAQIAAQITPQKSASQISREQNAAAAAEADRLNAEKAAAAAARPWMKDDQIDLAGYTPSGTQDPIFNDPTLTEYQRQYMTGKLLGLSQEQLDAMPMSDFEKLMDQRKQMQDDKTWLEKNINEQKNTLGRQLNESKAGVTSALAQGREGVVSQGNQMAGEAIKGVMQGQYNSQVAQLDRTVEEYNRAMAAGDAEAAEMLSTSIAQQKQAMAATAAENKAQSKELLDMLNESGALAGLDQDSIRALQDGLPDLPQGLVGLLSQAATRKALTEEKKTNFDIQKTALDTFKGLASEGIQMSPAMLKQMAASTGLPIDTLMEFNLNAQQIMGNKALTDEEKMIQLQRNGLLLDQEMNGIYGQDMQKMAYIESLYARGASQQEIDSVKTMLGITTDSRQIAETQIKQAEAAIKSYEAQYQGQPPPEGTLERIDYDKKKLELKEAQIKAGMNYGANLETDPLKQAFFQSGTNRSKRSMAGDNIRECGEAYNDITDGGKVGDGYNTGPNNKMSFVTKRDNPQVGNGLVLPIGPNGHIETLVSVNQVTGQIQTVSWNRNNDGKQTIETHSIEELNKKYGDKWGFTDSKLKPEYQTKVEQLQSKAAEKVTAEGKPKEPTEAQRLTSGFYNRMADAEKTLEKLETTINSMDTKDMLYQRNVPNFMKSKEMQMQEQAESNFLMAVLRKESGAAISPSELATGIKQYFPEAGDSEEVLKQKKRNREIQIASFKSMAGPAIDENFMDSFGEYYIPTANPSHITSPDEL